MNLKRGLSIPNEVVIQKGRQYNGQKKKEKSRTMNCTILHRNLTGVQQKSKVASVVN